MNKHTDYSNSKIQKIVATHNCKHSHIHNPDGKRTTIFIYALVSLMRDSIELVKVMNGFRTNIDRKSHRALYSKWIQVFMKQEHEHEHVAFLSFWLSKFVFPSFDRYSLGKHVIPIAVKLSQGDKLALAPAILASIYSNLTKLKEQNVEFSKTCIHLLGPFQLVQIWAYERLPIVGPKTPNNLLIGEPRLARWHTLKSSNASLPLLHSHITNPDNFIWRPYAIELKNWVQPTFFQDSEQILSDLLSLDDDFLSFVKFLQPCELNGLSCKEKYLPHRVSMQFGFDQDIPADYSTYKLHMFVKFFVPSRSFQPGVSMRYSDWWNYVDRKKDCISDQNSMVGEKVNVPVEDDDKKCVLQLRKNDVKKESINHVDLASVILQKDAAIEEKDKEIEALRKQIETESVNTQMKEESWTREKEKMNEAFNTIKSKNEGITHMVEDLRQRLHVLDPICKVTDLAIELGSQQALKTIQPGILPNVSLEKMHGYGGTLATRLVKACKEFDKARFACLETIAAHIRLYEEVCFKEP